MRRRGKEEVVNLRIAVDLRSQNGCLAILHKTFFGKLRGR